MSLFIQSANIQEMQERRETYMKVLTDLKKNWVDYMMTNNTDKFGGIIIMSQSIR